MPFGMRKQGMRVMTALLVILVILVEPLFADPLIKVCDSSQYKRVVEDTCSSVYKRGRHSKIIFNSYGFHRSRSKRETSANRSSRLFD